MGRLGEVLDFERAEDGPETKVDCGGGEIITAAHFDSAGVDAPPLPGDTAALEDSTGTGAQQVSGYQDTQNEGAASPGEVRFYARNSAGAIMAELWLKGDGTIEFSNLAGAGKLNPDGSAEINGAKVTLTGDVITASGVSLQNHLTPSPFGPIGPPTPEPSS